MTVVDKTHRHFPSGHVCSVELVKGLGCGRRNFPRIAAHFGLQLELMWTPLLVVPLCFFLSHLLSQVHRRKMQLSDFVETKNYWTLPEELRQPVVGVGGTQEKQGR